MTYILQAVSAAFMLSAMVLGYLASTHGDHGLVIFNCAIFWVNFALFFLQGRARKRRQA